MSDGTEGIARSSGGPSLRIVVVAGTLESPLETIGGFLNNNKGKAAAEAADILGSNDDELWDSGACFSNAADRAKIRLSIHGLPLVRVQQAPESSSSYEQAWPCLPGKSTAEQERRSNGERWARAVQPKFFRLGCEKWPTLQENSQARRRISSNEDGDYGRSGGLHILEQRGHILSTQEGPTATEKQQVESGRGGGICERWERSRSRRWMRLPPIVMPGSSSSSSNKENCNPAQKRIKSISSRPRSSSSNNNNGESSGSVAAEHVEEQRHHEQQQHLPPVLLMLNTDFIVTSSLEENLLLTLALSQKRECEDLAGPAAGSGSGDGGGKRRRQVLVGRFEAFSSFVRFGLGRDAKRVATESNAGGTSTISESLSVEYFARRFQAKDVVTEMEVEYCSMNWKKVDYICNLYGQRVGVSVTRAMSYPNPHDFSPQMAYRLLYKKLFGLVVARHGVAERHCFSQCILHVWCETRATAKILEAQYRDVSEELDITDDVIMVLTVAEGWHARPIFYESCLERS